jgi:hypothetical protein
MVQFVDKKEPVSPEVRKNKPLFGHSRSLIHPTLKFMAFRPEFAHESSTRFPQHLAEIVSASNNQLLNVIAEHLHETWFKVFLFLHS